jgi:hypothetical protein
MSNPPDPLAEAQARLRDNRARVLAGETVSDEEYRDLIAGIRATRIAATQAELRRPRRASAPITLTDEELKSL